jgi:type VII secretion integral membrane protein EccD
LTLPPSLSELDAESESEQELSRITLVVGGLRFDVGVPANVSIGAFIDDVLDIANDQIATRPELAEIEFDNEPGKWTLSRLGAEPIDQTRSLADANVYDGEVLTIAEVGRPVSPLLFDDIEVAADQAPRSAADWLTSNARLVACFTVGLVTTVTIAVLLPGQAADWMVAAAALGVGVLGVLTACVIAYRSAGARRSEWVAAMAMPLIFGGSLYVVPGGHGAKSLPMAFALTALASLVMMLISGRGRALHTAVIAFSALGGLAAIIDTVWQLPERTVGALVATASVLVVYLSPRVTILLSKLPIPRVPTAGEQLDDIETQGGTTVEGVNALGKQIIPTEAGMIDRLRRANQYLTGIIVAAAGTAAVGCYLAIDFRNGFYWQGAAFAIAVATVLCLRGRSHHDLLQSATLVGGGVTIALILIVKAGAYLEHGWQLYSTLMLVVFMTLTAVCGVIAPRLDFSPVMRRQVEILEFIAIATIFPLCCWIIRLYAFFRELRI